MTEQIPEECDELDLIELEWDEAEEWQLKSTETMTF